VRVSGRQHSLVITGQWGCIRNPKPPQTRIDTSWLSICSMW